MNRPLNSKQLAALRPLWPDSAPRVFQIQADRLASPGWELDRKWWLCMAARCQRVRSVLPAMVNSPGRLP